MVLQFKIQLKGIIKPPVWRRVEVPANVTFLEFHDVIQVLFGWEDYHLFEFRDKDYPTSIRITALVEDDSFDSDFYTDAEDASEVKLSDIFTGNIRRFLYVYDFGDNWTHEITLEASLEKEQKTAVCLAGKGACPPEDCGSIWGYERLKDVFETAPNSEDAEEYREWLGLEEGENWDANAFDIEDINECLKDI